MTDVSVQRVVTAQAATYTGIPFVADDNVDVGTLPETGFAIMDWNYGEEAAHATRLDGRLLSVGFRIYRPKGVGAGPALLDAEEIKKRFRPSETVSGQLLAPAGDSGVLYYVRSRTNNIGRDTAGSVVNDPLMKSFKRVDAVVILQDFSPR